MSSKAEAKARDLSDFLELLQEIEQAGVGYVVIGGCAVGAYARLAGEAVFSDDLDLYVSLEDLRELLAWARRSSVEVKKTPQPRAVPVAVLEWQGLEVNALTASDGLPPADQALRSCREFELEAGGARVYLADPFDLLTNKLRVHRPKDLPHIAVLKRYLQLEVKESFGSKEPARQRLEMGRRYLQVVGDATLPGELLEALIPLADEAPLRRFLARGMVDATLQRRLLERAESDDERRELGDIFAESGEA